MTCYLFLVKYFTQYFAYKIFAVLLVNYCKLDNDILTCLNSFAISWRIKKFSFFFKGCSLPHYLSQLTYNFDPATDRVKSLKHIFLSEQGSFNLQWSIVVHGRVKIFTFISQVSRALQNRNIALFMFTSHPILMTTKNFRCL